MADPIFLFTVTLSAAYDQLVTMSLRVVNDTATTSGGDSVGRLGTLDIGRILDSMAPVSTRFHRPPPVTACRPKASHPIGATSPAGTSR